MSKKKYTKCQCCPYYAKDYETGKWSCSRIDRNEYSYGNASKVSGKGLCIFNYLSSDENVLVIANDILNRWINANKD